MYHLLQDSERMSCDSESGIFLVVENGKASIRSTSLFKIVTKNGTLIERIRITLEVADHRINSATIKITPTRL